MKKVALVFVVAVFVPSLVLGWLAIRSVRDQQMVAERQQWLLYQGVADALAQGVREFLAERQHDFAQRVETLQTMRGAREAASCFDEELRQTWPLAEVGFAVTLKGDVLSPSMLGHLEGCRFRLENDRFFCCEPVEVYWNSPRGPISLSKLQENRAATPGEPDKKGDGGIFATKSTLVSASKNGVGGASPQAAPSEAEFRQLIGDSYEGTLARFVQNRLKLLFWYRSRHEPQLVFGAQLDLKRLVAGLQESVQVPESLRGDITAALLDDTGKPMAGRLHEDRQPLVTCNIGQILPHWAIAVYLQNPAQLTHAAQTLRLTLTLIIGLLMLAIVTGGALIVADVKRQITLAAQKTDFVSNVSHELKTPLTSIRMFGELLAEGRADDERQRRYLQIITSETARLTRLINNVLDFDRLARGKQKYHFADCDLASVLRKCLGTYRPYLESAGFKLECDLPSDSVMVNGDADALAQVLVNLLSNAEKYTGERKEILIQMKRVAGRRSKSQPGEACRAAAPGNGVELEAPGRAGVDVRVLDRGLGVPHGCERRIFDQFFRAHDSLASGIQGSGLGLTLGRQIARAHGGDLVYEPREGGGSCFILKLPGSVGVPPAADAAAARGAADQVDGRLLL
ncbi:MAG: HAMP domain-containing histidine kinase [Verrucomicrobia bacterium]|nr:HAMP domain-containing histidine kinase [Verrucomicrobiota bacterium]